MRFVNRSPEDPAWTAHIEVLNQWTPDDRVLRDIIHSVRSGPHYPADMHVDLIKQYCLIRSEVWDHVQPCEEHCTPERHAYHQGQWDMAGRIDPARLTEEQVS